jgi:TonB family protein
LRREPALAALALTIATLVAGGQSTPPTPPTAESTNITPASGAASPSGATQPSDNTTVPITPPRVIRQSNPDYSYEARKKKINGICLVSFTVDTDGVPQSVRVVKSLEPSLDANAAQAIETWRFKPALKDGKTPIPFDLTVEVSFRLLDTHNSASVVAILARPDEPGILLSYDGSRVIPPIPITQIAPKYPFWAKVGRIRGDCTVGMIVDSEGVPQNVHLVKSADLRLDESALKAVKQWRYKPASKDGAPVPVEMSVIVKFHLD